jgi:hypothetical protein
MAEESNARVEARQQPFREGDKRQKQIVDDMNADHRDTLALFLEYYCRIPQQRAMAAAKLEEILLSGMIMTAGRNTRYLVPFEPPLSSLDEVQRTVVEMQQECLLALNVSDIPVKKYRPPRGFPLVIFTACVVTFVTFAWRGVFLPGSIPYALVFRHVPKFAEFCYAIQPLLMALMVAIHLSEAVYLALYRLRPHRITLFSRLWWMWFINDFLEGFTTLRRFDAIVHRERAKKGQHKPTVKK